ncbi:cytochrome c [Dissulfurispira thermophila]|uniref:Cytochrome c n=1 Tax=Dissulfurispira thermophila TaxID=2715679 RepID=A0A7G1GZS1_9BACT|nr:cytochrome c3 family protein [Dissulfurispira thermophila]BCB96005.1 cytochrome c [Dissulfurispira thermophila]
MKGKILIVMVVAIALLCAGVALAGISATKHNLSSTGPGTVKASAGQQNDEICVYCHTPHFANTGFTGAPLWNKATPAGSYTMYGTTIAGTTPDATPNGITKACLSCHDGVSAINSIVNEAGSGKSGPANVAFGTTAAGTAFTMPAGATNLGTSLADDHPVSITYTAGKASLNPTTTTLTGWTGASTIADLLRNGKVECSSCHDPHTSATSLFLRVSNSGSALCLGCHGK